MQERHPEVHTDPDRDDREGQRDDDPVPQGEHGDPGTGSTGRREHRRRPGPGGRRALLGRRGRVGWQAWLGRRCKLG
ncbi:hypothetical protein GCM10010423_34780 [Streptomyces levis]|uniref:Uncharacterized protein n=1 Tax=Streptomyces levis TaxID=285566 RepID=A0ABP6B3H1_9ACTN